MKIKEVSRLDTATVEEIRCLVEECNTCDQGKARVFLDTSLNVYSDMNCTYLLHEEEKLTSFLFMFVPTRQEAEISAYTLPQYRKKGNFKVLFAKAAEELKKYGISDVLFVCEAQSAAAREAVEKLGAKLDRTEYYMKYNKRVEREEKREYRLQLKPAEQKDVDMLTGLSCNIFHEDEEAARGYIISALQAKDREQFYVTWEGIPVGMGAIGTEEGKSSIFGLGILPQHRGKGLGKELLHLLVDNALKNQPGDVALEVDSTNDTAFQLYKNNGFEVETAYDYYRKTL